MLTLILISRLFQHITELENNEKVFSFKNQIIHPQMEYFEMHFIPQISLVLNQEQELPVDHYICLLCSEVDGALIKILFQKMCKHKNNIKK